jgi:Domain of unknown function (DUF4383)
MAKLICTILGVVFLLVGVTGFFAPTFGGTHLTVAHNLVHIVSGAVSLYFGLAGTMSAARSFALLFGIFYLLLGVAGFFFGTTETTSLPPHTVAGAVNQHMFRAIPGVLEFGTVDHLIHVGFGALFMFGAISTKARVRPVIETEI